MILDVLLSIFILGVMVIVYPAHHDYKNRKRNERKEK